MTKAWVLLILTPNGRKGWISVRGESIFLFMFRSPDVKDASRAGMVTGEGQPWGHGGGRTVAGWRWPDVKLWRAWSLGSECERGMDF